MTVQQRVWLSVLRFWYPYGPAPRAWWQPGYVLTLDGAQPRTVRVSFDEPRSAECPKSRLMRAPEAAELVSIAGQAERTGGAALGKASTWPGFLYDAVSVLKAEREIDKAAQTKAIYRS